MYCPNGGHQPSSATPRFCSSCGMRLDGVVRLIEMGGALELAAFTPFFTTKANGQVIGLTLVREILNNHRFDFTLEGGPGLPTQFTIFF